jgi:hypothetical protein
MRKFIQRLLLLLAPCSLLLNSCDRRPLEVYYHNVAQVRIDVDWESRFGEVPTGMTMLLARDGDAVTNSRITHDVHSQTFQLEPATYKLLVFNLSSGEFGSMRFEDLGSHHNAAARAENITTRYTRAWDRGATYMTDPELIGCAVDTFAITEEMIEDYYTFVDYRQRGNIPDTAQFVFKEVVDPMITHLHAKVYVKGFDNMRSVEASITGMADGFWMSRVDRTQDPGTMLLDSWTATPNGSENTGWITTTINTFGMPFGKEKKEDRAEEDNVLTLAFLLKDGTVKTFTYNVGKIMRYETPTGDALTKAEILRDIYVEIVLDDPIDSPDLPDVDPDSKNASGFDAHVDDWEDGGTIEVGF